MKKDNVKNIRKILTAAILLMFIGNFCVAPAFAIVENVPVVERVNFDWWKQFDDTYLEGYIARALQENHDIKTAQLKLEEAKINIQATRSAQLPTVSVGAAPVLAKMPTKTSTSGSFAVPAMVQYELDLFLKNADKTKSAKIMAKSAEFQQTAADISIVALVGSVYYNIVKLDKMIELEKQLVQDRKTVYDLMKISNEEGVVSTSDLIIAEKNYVLAQNDLIELEKSRQNALTSLAVLIGDSPENIGEYKRIAYDDLKDNLSFPNEISSGVITNRPDYKALEASVEAAGLDVRVAKKEFLPTIDILGLVTYVAASGMSMNWESALALAGANITLPLFTGLRKTANLRFNKNKYKQILEQYQKTNLTAIQEVNDSLYWAKSDTEKLQNNQKAYAIQKEDFGFTKDKYAQGVISLLDLTQREEALIYTEQLLVLSKIDCYLDSIGLYKATGAQI